MTKKLKKILENFKMGKLKTTYNLKLTLEDFLSKDEEGITLLENIIKLDGSIYFSDEQILKNSIEAGYIYCENKKPMYFFEYNEDQLFTEINGKLFIEYLIENNRLTSNMIKSIKSHVEIIDMLDSGNYYQFQYFTEELKNKLITKKEDGTYLIEKYIEEEQKFRYLLEEYNDPKVIIEVCKKYNKYELLKYSNEKALMYELKDNYTLFDDLMNDNIIPVKLSSIPDDVKYVNYLRSKNLYKYLKDAREDVITLKIDGEQTLLEDLIAKGAIDKINFTIFKKDIIHILYKLNKLNLIEKVDQDLLCKQINEVIDIKVNKTVLDYLLDKGIEVSYSSFGTREEDIIKILYKKGRFDLISKSLTKKNLLLEVEKGIPLIDKMLEIKANINFGFDGFNDERISKKLYEHDRADLLLHGRLPILLQKINGEYTYLDYILESIKSKKIKYNLSNYSLYSYDVKDVANFYLTVAKHDMMEYIQELDDKKLLNSDKGSNLLDELLKQDKDLTLNKILIGRNKAKLNVATVLKSKGIDLDYIEVPLESKNFSKEYLDSRQQKLGIGPLQYDGEYLLNRLSSLFLNDGSSDKELIEAFISGYRQALFLDYENVTNELKELVEIKENNMDDFSYLRDEDSAYFKPGTGSVYLDNTVIETILHETGHALHSYLTDDEMPKDYERIVKDIRENKDVLKKVEKFSNEYLQLRNKTEELARKKYERFFEKYYTEEKSKEIRKFMQKSLEEKKGEFKSLNISDDVLNLVLENIFTEEEYINHQKKLYINEYTDVICRTEYGSLMAIADILDAIYEGELHSGTLKNEEGKDIQRTPGHGLAYYYNNPKKGFSEMVANFAAITKSKNSKEMLETLKDITGQELYNMLSNFYYTNILKTKEEQRKL